MRILKRVTPSLILLSLLLVATLGFGQTIPAAACPLHAGQSLSITTSGATEVIPIPTGASLPVFNGAGVKIGVANSPKVVICSVQLQVIQPGTPSDYGLVTGTGSNCATGQAALTPMWQGTASVTTVRDFLYGSNAPLIAPPGKAVCLKLSANVTKAQILINYVVVGS
jgi:hypothetical protein